MLIWARRAHNKTVVASQGVTTSSQFMKQKWWLELSEGHENWYEEGDGRCRRNDIFRFGITRAQRAYLCAKRANPPIFMVLWGKVAARIVGGS